MQCLWDKKKKKKKNKRERERGKEKETETIPTCEWWNKAYERYNIDDASARFYPIFDYL